MESMGTAQPRASYPAANAVEVGQSRFDIPIRWSNHRSANFFGSFATTTDFFVAVGLCREAVSAYRGTTSRRQSAVKRQAVERQGVAYECHQRSSPGDPQRSAVLRSSTNARK